MAGEKTLSPCLRGLVPVITERRAGIQIGLSE